MVAVLDRPEVQHALRRELARRELAEFCALMDPRYERAMHTDLLCAELEAVDRGENDRLIVMMPPRHSKTWHTSVHFPAWTMGRNPRQQVILASYAAELAWQNSRQARELFRHPLWPFAARLRDDSQAMNRWHTDDGGILLASGVGGALTGFGAHKLLIDDFVKNREDADSEVIREKQWGWFTSTARTRLMPGGAIVVTATHWHEDDLIGRIMNGQGAARWRLVRLPALAEPDDVLGRPEGAALWPAWYDVDALAEIKQDIGSREWSALYQQRPTSDEGGIFKRAWFSDRYEQAPEGLHVVLAVDAAFKTGVNNDYSAIVAMGTDRLHHYVLDVTRDRLEYPELRRAILDAAERWRPRCVLIEDTAAGQSAIQELRRMRGVPPILPMRVTASKEARAQAVAPLAEAGKVRLPARGSWLGAFVDELTAFPTGQHDDQTDAFVLALQRCADVAATYRPAGTRRIVGRQGSIVSSGGGY